MHLQLDLVGSLQAGRLLALPYMVPRLWMEIEVSWNSLVMNLQGNETPS
jgi:hypothetical protein